MAEPNDPPATWTHLRGRLAFAPAPADPLSPYGGWPGRTIHVSAILWIPAAIDDARLKLDYLTRAGGEEVLVAAYWAPAFERKPETAQYALPIIIAAPAERGLLPDHTVLDGMVAEFVKRAFGLEPAEALAMGFRLSLGRTLPPQAVPIPTSRTDSWAPSPLVAKDDGPLALIGILDDAIPFAHTRFRDAAGGSRIEYCWLQGAATTLPQLGRELTRNDIDALIQTHGGDEDMLYRAAGAYEANARDGSAINHAGTHGSHVLDGAAGHDHGERRPFDAVLPPLDRARIITVQFAASVVIDTARFAKDPLVLMGLYHLFERADRVAQGYRRGPLPLIVNMSYGITSGPHDGSSDIERLIDFLVLLRRIVSGPTHVILPAGNTFQDALCGRLDFTGRDGPERASFQWHIPPGDRTVNGLELWFSRGANLAGLSVTIADPNGPVTLSPAPGTLAGAGTATLLDDAGRKVGKIGWGPQFGRPCIYIEIMATEPTQPGHRARAGHWTVTLNAAESAALKGPVELRIVRDNDPFGYRQGARSSSICDPADVPFLPGGEPADDDSSGPLKRFGTVNGLATGQRVILAGGYCGATGKATPYTAGGTKRAPFAPDAAGHVHCSAVADEGRVLPGLRRAGTRSGATFRLNGTSVAAPQVARSFVLAYLNGAQPAPASVPALDGLALTALGAMPATAAAGQEEQKRRERRGNAIFPPVP